MVSRLARLGKCAILFLYLAGPHALLVAQSPSSPPKNPEALKKLDAALKTQLQNDYRGARQLYEEARALDPTLKGIDYQLAVIAFNLSDYPAARSYLDKSLALKEEEANCHLLLGVIAGQEKNYPTAISEFQKAAELNPADPQSFFNLGETYRETGEPEKAIDPMRKAVQRKPSEILYAFKLRLARIAAGQSAEVERETNDQLKLVPPAGDWLMTAAALALQRGEYPQAATLLYRSHDAMQPSLFFAMLQDPLFKKYASETEMLPFYDVQFSHQAPSGGASPAGR